MTMKTTLQMPGANPPSLWAIQPEAAPAALQALSVPLADSEASGSSGAAAPASGAPGSAAGYRVENGLAVVPVRGALTKNGLSYGDCVFFGSMRGIAQAVCEAAQDPSARAILLDVESPGGTVDGIEELADAVKAAGLKKPLYAFADGLMASAAYWLSCSAKKIAAPATALVGSIGVISVHAEYSKMLENAGVKVSILSAGKYKAAGNNVEPLTSETRAYLQSGIDAVYELFLSEVQAGRRCDNKKALAMADGKIFMAEEARQVGLIDRVCSRQTFINEILGGQTMSIKELRAQHPEEMAELRAEVETEFKAEAKAESDAVLADVRANAVAGVLEMASAVLGEEAGKKLAAVVASGVTAAQLSALSGFFSASAPQNANGKFGAQMLSAIRDAHAAAHVEGSPKPAPAGTPGFMELVDEHQKTAACSRGEAIRACASAHPDAHKNWLNEQLKGE